MKSTVYVLQHLHELKNGCSDVKFIGVYSSLSFAMRAIEKLSRQPGFLEAPLLRDPMVDDEVEGFYIDEYTIDEDHWEDGYVTI